MFRPVRLSEIILKHCYFVGIRTSQPGKNASSLLKSGCAARLGAATRNYNQHHVDQNATQASEGGTQDANCEAPERTSPTSWRSHVTEYANILWQHRYVSTESEKCPVERPLPGQNAHFE